MSSNKSMGNHFEAALCEMLSKQGFWAHNLAQRAEGQPADIIAVKCNTAVLIDCKVCSSYKFDLSRMEENQIYAMSFWGSCGNYFSYFAVRVPDGKVYMLPFCELVQLLNHHCKSVQDFSNYPTFQEWCKYFLREVG